MLPNTEEGSGSSPTFLSQPDDRPSVYTNDKWEASVKSDITQDYPAPLLPGGNKAHGHHHDSSCEAFYLKVHSCSLGIAGFLFFNVYLSVLDFFNQTFPDYKPVPYFLFFYNFFTLATGTGVSFLNDAISIRTRVAYGSIALGICIGLLPCLMYWIKNELQCFIAFICFVVLTTVFSTSVQISGIGFSVLLGKSYAGWAGAGLALGSIITNIIRSITLLVVSDEVYSNAIFFGTAFVFCIGVGISQLIAERTQLSKYHLGKIRSKSLTESMREHVKNTGFFFTIKTFGRLAFPGLQIALNYTISNGVFPGLATLNNLTFFDETKTVWSNLSIVFAFSVTDFTGRVIAGQTCRMVSDWFVAVFVLLRLSFFPLFLWISTLSTSSTLDIAVLAGTMALGISNGLVTNWILIRAPTDKKLPATMRELAGVLVTLYLFIGLVPGACLAVLFSYVKI